MMCVIIIVCYRYVVISDKTTSCAACISYYSSYLCICTVAAATREGTGTPSKRSCRICASDFPTFKWKAVISHRQLLTRPSPLLCLTANCYLSGQCLSPIITLRRMPGRSGSLGFVVTRYGANGPMGKNVLFWLPLPWRYFIHHFPWHLCI